MIELKNVTKWYLQSKDGGTIFKSKNKVEALKNVNFLIGEKERVGLVGLNGAGKSTMIKLITGIMKPNEGDVSLFCRNAYKYRKINSRDYGILFGQKSNLIWDLSPKKSFELLKDIYGVRKEDFISTFTYLDDKLNLKNLYNTPIREMSLGQRMRFEVASIILHKPKLLILDEAFLGIDFVTKNHIITLLKEYVEDNDASLLITSHDIKDIEKSCDRIIILDNGEVRADTEIFNLKSIYKYKRLQFETDPSHNNINENTLEELKSMSGIVDVVQDKYKFNFLIEKRSMENLIVDISNILKPIEYHLSEVSLEDVLLDMSQANDVNSKEYDIT